MNSRDEPLSAGDAVTLSVSNPQPAQPADDHSISFHDILHALNPLQYIPVVGTIYRAVTGDQIPELLRRGGSLLVSTLMGGPVGAITNIATTILEKITGFDIDKTMQTAMGAHIGGALTNVCSGDDGLRDGATASATGRNRRRHGQQAVVVGTTRGLRRRHVPGRNNDHGCRQRRRRIEHA